MTKQHIHLELDSLIELTNDHKTIVKTADIPAALNDLRVIIEYMLLDREASKRELKSLRKNRE